MSNKEMPVAETSSYELAFHVLPTVAEGEVTTVFQNLKDMITKAGGDITSEEAPARFDLAYEIVKYLEGRNRKFSSAYFGWVRFSVDPSNINKIEDGVDGVKELLRHLLIKLTKVEEENPFLFHEALMNNQKSRTIDLDEDGSDESAEETETNDESEAESAAEADTSNDEEK